MCKDIDYPKPTNLFNGSFVSIDDYDCRTFIISPKQDSRCKLFVFTTNLFVDKFFIACNFWSFKEVPTHFIIFKIQQTSLVSTLQHTSEQWQIRDKMGWKVRWRHEADRRNEGYTQNVIYDNTTAYRLQIDPIGSVLNPCPAGATPDTRLGEGGKL